MAEQVELEIGLERWSDGYAVDLRLARPGSDADIKRQGVDLRLPLDDLRGLTLDNLAYGRRLGHDFFAHPDVTEVFAQARATEGPLRLRLVIEPNAQELDGLRWETLADPDLPEPGSPLLMGERIYFSRYVNSPDWRMIRRRAKGDLRALAVVANPSDLDRYQLAPIDAAAQIQLARDGMKDIEIEILGESDRATLDTLVDRLGDGPDILYLVCHGALVDGTSALWLENADGASDRREGSELVARLHQLERLPRLVVLVSCQSAGSGVGDALGALGPKLAEAGVPAVLAMHGDVQMATAAAFLPAFFRALQEDGQIDRAVAHARAAVQDRPDAWSPVLYMRLKSGSLWYEPGFAEEKFEKWPSVLSHIDAGECTPILGPGLAESLIGSRRETALHLADDFDFPMAPHAREELPQVAQFVRVNQAKRTLLSELEKSFRRELLRRLDGDTPPEMKDASLDALVVAVGKRRWEADTNEPHRVLAELPCPVYVTTALDSLMAEALRAAGKEPRVELFRWNDGEGWPDSVYKDDPEYYPDAQKPLVYHLFGHLNYRDTLVLTEDDYFDFLIGATRKRDEIPGVVRSRLADTALLFLGFEMGGWDFRVLFRSIMSQPGQGRQDFAHAGVQIDPEEGRILEIDRARKYLETYFEDAEISIYWGSADDFARDLRRQREPSP
jgi:hypothetical protein